MNISSYQEQTTKETVKMVDISLFYVFHCLFSALYLTFQYVDERCSGLKLENNQITNNVKQTQEKADFIGMQLR